MSDNETETATKPETVRPDPQIALARPYAMAKAAATFWGIGLVLALLTGGVILTAQVLLLVFAALLFAIFLRSLAAPLRHYTELTDGLALAVVVAGLVVIGSVWMWLAIPSIVDQTQQLQESLPQAVDRLEHHLSRYSWGDWLLDHALPTDAWPQGKEMLTRLLGVVSNTTAFLGSVLVIIVTGLFLATQPTLYVKGIVLLAPPSRRDRVRELLEELHGVLKWWLVGKIITMFFVGLLVWIGFWLLGLKMALTLAVLAALLTFIPTFGPITAGIPAVLVGLLDSPTTALYVLILYVAVQVVETNLLTPLIQQQTVSLAPALLISMQLIMVTLLGILGLALATPLTVVGLVLVKSVYLRDILGDKESYDRLSK